jgi:glycosyltransferase involved in cell wall biosynthesis
VSALNRGTPPPNRAKPRLCIVNPFEHGGGAEYQISLLIDALAAEERYEIHYLTHFVDERERSRNYQVDQIGDGGPPPRFGYLMDGPALYARLRELQPCLIYQRVAGGYTGVSAHYARRRGVPMLWHVAHDTDVTPRHLDPSRNLVRVRLEKWAVEYGVRHASRIIVQTRHQAELLERNYGRRIDAIVPNFHPPAREKIDKSGPTTVLWIANLKPWKRPEAFVQLAKHFASNHDVRFVMIGAAPPDSGWSASLLRDIESSPNLSYVGQKTHEEVNELLARAHIFVNTSTHEGFPNTFIQAWQRDVAVVSLSVDPDQVLERERAGIASHTEAGLVEALRTLIEHPDVRADYARRGRAHAEARHSLRNARTLVELIHSTAGTAAA